MERKGKLMSKIGFVAGMLFLTFRPETLSGKGNPSYIARRQQHNTGNASLKIKFKPAAANEFAGLAAFQGKKDYYVIGKTLNKSNETVVQLLKSEDTEYPSSKEATTILAEIILSKTEADKAIFLNVDFHGGD